MQGDIETILGGSGNDSITGDASPESLDGGAGNDTLDGGDGADDLYGGDGTDVADYSSRTSTEHVNVSLNSLTADNDGESGEGDDVAYCEVAWGGAGNDTLTGDDNANTLLGNDGNDSLSGGGNNDSIDGGAHGDTIYGDDGADIVRGGGSFDYIYGGAGNDHVYGYGILDGGDNDDLFYLDNNFPDTVNGGDGNDTIVNTDGSDSDEYWTSIEVRP